MDSLGSGHVRFSPAREDKRQRIIRLLQAKGIDADAEYAGQMRPESEQKRRAADAESPVPGALQQRSQFPAKM